MAYTPGEGTKITYEPGGSLNRYSPPAGIDSAVIDSVGKVSEKTPAVLGTQVAVPRSTTTFPAGWGGGGGLGR
jgi:hypothetical protein